MVSTFIMLPSIIVLLFTDYDPLLFVGLSMILLAAFLIFVLWEVAQKFGANEKER
jgi:hypothetical protein